MVAQHAKANKWRNKNGYQRNGGNYNRHRNSNRHNNYRNNRSNHRNNNVGAGVAAGIAAGIIGGIIADSASRNAPPPRRGGYNRHVEWCLDNYRTYDPRTDTYVSRRYGVQRCRSPYN